MPRLPISEQALRLASSSQSTQYVCRACRAQAIRHFSVSTRTPAEVPFFQRLRNSVFGTPESREADKKRDALHQQRVQDLAERGTLEQEYTDSRGRVWKKASLVDPSVNEGYVPATNWKDLEKVGGAEWVRSRRDEGELYIGFNPRRKLQLTNPEWQVLLHHVAVEVMALYQAGRDLNDVTNNTDIDAAIWRLAAAAEFKESNGSFALQFMSVEDEQLVLDHVSKRAGENAEALKDELPGNDGSVDLESVNADKTGASLHHNIIRLDSVAKVRMQALKEAIQNAASQSNKSSILLSLQEPAIKLALLKRVFQLSNHRLSDPIISRATTLSDFYHAYITKPAPKKLAQSKELKKLNVTAPNVTVYSKRRTPMDKDKEVGRWKVIEEELLNRRLPVTGSRYQGAKTTSPLP